MDGDLLQDTCIATSVLAVVLAVVTTLSNGFLLYVLYKDPLKRFTKPVTIFITAIALIDFLTGALYDPSQAWFEIRCALKMKTEIHSEFGGFNAIIGFFTINSVNLLVLAMSVERFLAVRFPHFYRQAVTRKRAILCVIGVCVHCFVFSLLQLAEINFYLFQTVDFYLHVVFPILSVIVTYVAICLVLRRQRNKLQTVSDKTDVNDGRINQKRCRNQMHKRKSEQQVVFTACIITLLLILTFLPYTTMIIVAENCKNCFSNGWFAVLSRVAIPFMFTNSATNPFVYVLRMRDLRRSIKKTLGLSTSRNKNTTAVERWVNPPEEANDSLQIASTTQAI